MGNRPFHQTRLNRRLLTVTIGIPAYNEAANIGILLQRLIEQPTPNCILEKIIVVSDGSNDATVAVAKSVANPKMVVFSHSQRKGQAVRQNQIFNLSNSDITVLFNADILPDSNILEQLIAPFYKRPNLGLVGIRVTPLSGHTVVEKTLVRSSLVKQRVFEKWQHGRSIYTCHGRARAFSKTFYKQLRWPRSVGEDAYSYLACLQAGFDYHYNSKAEVFYRCPQTFRDHIRQSVRFYESKAVLIKHFGETVVEKAFAYPFFAFLPIYWHAARHFPLQTLLYMGLLVFSKSLGRRFYQAKQRWEPSITSKTLLSPAASLFFLCLDTITL